MRRDPQIVDKLPSHEALAALTDLVARRDATEKDGQAVLARFPQLLLPLEFAEVLDEFRFPKMDKLEPSRQPSPREARIVDFVGIHVRPFALPILCEAKGPGDTILDRSTGMLTVGQQGARTLIGQLEEAVTHLMRDGGNAVLRSIFGDLPDELFDERDSSLFREVQAGVVPSPDLVTQLMLTLSRSGVALVALMGSSQEFRSRDDVLMATREVFARRGCVLVLWDELLHLNEMLCDYCARSQGLLDYFSSSVISMHDGRLVKFSAIPFLDPDTLAKVQRSMVRVLGNICLFGLGSPPRHEVELRANFAFNPRFLWAPPTYLGGHELLLWAGRMNGLWLVFKQRLTEPGAGKVVRYQFFDPAADEHLAGGPARS